MGKPFCFCGNPNNYVLPMLLIFMKIISVRFPHTKIFLQRKKQITVQCSMHLVSEHYWWNRNSRHCSAILPFTSSFVDFLQHPSYLLLCHRSWKVGGNAPFPFPSSAKCSRLQRLKCSSPEQNAFIISNKHVHLQCDIVFGGEYSRGYSCRWR